MNARLALVAAAIVAVFVTPAMLWSAAASAQSKPAAAKPDVAKGQKIAGEACAACHASDGNSTQAANPVLAGQGYDYLLRQLRGFKLPKDKDGARPNAVMTAMVANLSDDDLKALAAFYAQQKPKGLQARNKETVGLGERIYRGGIPDRQIASCAGCHGPTGAGIPAQYPRLAGQHADYTEAQLKAFRIGERYSDPNRMMRMVAAKMNDREIQAVSDYIAGLR